MHIRQRDRRTDLLLLWSYSLILQETVPLLPFVRYFPLFLSVYPFFHVDDHFLIIMMHKNSILGSMTYGSGTCVTSDTKCSKDGKRLMPFEPVFFFVET